MKCIIFLKKSVVHSGCGQIRVLIYDEAWKLMYVWVDNMNIPKV